MPTSKLTVHPCAFNNMPCENYTCRQAAPSIPKFFIGNPEGYSQKPIFCLDCITHMFANIPPELIEGGAELKERLEAEYAEKFTNERERLIAELTPQIEEAVTKRLVVKFAGYQKEGVTESFISNDELQGGDDDPEASDPNPAFTPPTDEPQTPDPDDEDDDEDDEPNAIQPPPKEPPPANAAPKRVFRCLDCNAEFATPILLGKHKKAEHS